MYSFKQSDVVSFFSEAISGTYQIGLKGAVWIEMAWLSTT